MPYDETAGQQLELFPPADGVAPEKEPVPSQAPAEELHLAADHQKMYEPDAQQVKLINNNFVYHAPKPGQSERYTVIRDTAKELAMTIVRLTPKTRESALAIAKLEEAVFWANAAIARNE